MKKNVNLTKKFIIVLLVALLFLYIITGRSFADTVINLDSLETIETIETTNKTNNIINDTEPQKNSSAANESGLPETGSNTEVIFIIGITVLAGTAIYVYNKSIIK